MTRARAGPRFRFQAKASAQAENPRLRAARWITRIAPTVGSYADSNLERNGIRAGGTQRVRAVQAWVGHELLPDFSLAGGGVLRNFQLGNSWLLRNFHRRE